LQTAQKAVSLKKRSMDKYPPTPNSTESQSIESHMSQRLNAIHHHHHHMR